MRLSESSLVVFKNEKGVVVTSGTLTIKEEGANRSLLWVTNPTNKSIVLDTCMVRGQKITDFGTVDATAVDSASVSLYGHREMLLNLRAVDNQDAAQGIADFELIRRKQPTGKVQTVTVRSHGISGGGQHSHQLARTIGDRIKIIETQTGHTGEYFIIGERHKLNNSMTRYETTWYLESATEGHWFMIDEDDIVTPDGNGEVPEDSAVLLPI